VRPAAVRAVVMMMMIDDETYLVEILGNNSNPCHIDGK
jgi:hypothetical protein